MPKFNFSSKIDVTIFVALLVVFLFPKIMIFAKDDIADQLYYILDIQDIEKGEELLNRITLDDIDAMNDTTLLNYHYLAAYINSEHNLHEETLSHLLEGKKICETSVGILNIKYLEILLAMGEEYENYGEYDEAIIYYQEGIVKGLLLSDSAGVFQFLITGLANAYQKKGWKEEVPGLWQSAWFYWDKNTEPFYEMNYFPLLQLESFYYEQGEYEKGLSVIEIISDFVKEKEGENSSAYGKVMFYRGNLLNKLGRNEEAIQDYQKGIELVMRYAPSNLKDIESLYGNLINAYAEAKVIDGVDDILFKINQMKKNLSPSFCKNVLFSISTTFMNIRQYDEALKYLNILLSSDENFTDAEKDMLTQREQDLTCLKDNSEKLQELKNQASLYSEGTIEWVEYKKNLSQVYFQDFQYENAIETLMEIYDWNRIQNKLSLEDFVNVAKQIVEYSKYGESYETIIKVAPCWIDYVKENLGQDSEEYYSSLCLLLVAQIRLNRPIAARGTIEIITPLCLTLYGENSIEYVINLHNQGRIYQLEENWEKARDFFNQSISEAKRLSLPQENISRTIQCLGEVELKLMEVL